jgi:formylglycine-generating enzyme required for sulfatase activity
MTLPAAVVLACIVGAHDLAGKPCPCLEDQGFVCDRSTNRCVRPDLALPDANSNSDADAALGADAPDGAIVAPNGCPPGMVRAGNPGVCIDATEVSAKQYFAFARDAVAANRVPQHLRCAWLNTWAPDQSAHTIAENEKPIVSVNWCQAFEYCAAGGKRLCGRFGSASGLGSADLSKSDRDEWYVACTGGDGRAYSYGNEFSPTACNTAGDASVDGREPVGSRKTCEGGVTGLFDMSGNVAELIDACEERDGGTGRGDVCYTRAPNYDEYAPANVLSQCRRTDAVSRSTVLPFIGFRCCATPTP